MPRQSGPNREFVGHDFRDEDLSRLRTERVVFNECDFSGVDLTESEHLGSAFRNCNFRRTSLWHSTFRQCSLLGSVFTECRMRPITLVEVDLTLAVLGGCDLRGVDLSDCRLREASLVGRGPAQGGAAARRPDAAPGPRTPSSTRPICAAPRSTRRFWTTAKVRGARSTSTRRWPTPPRTGWTPRRVTRDLRVLVGMIQTRTPQIATI